MSDTPRLLTMTAEDWRFHDGVDSQGHQLDVVRVLRAEVLAQAARVRELEQERERIRQALESMPHDRSCEYFYCVQCACDVRTCEHKQHGECNCGKSVLKSLPPAGEREAT